MLLSLPISTPLTLLFWLYLARVQVMENLIMPFSPTSYYFIPIRFKYSPQHPVLKHPQSVFFR
jgi:hypothetical protein